MNANNNNNNNNNGNGAPTVHRWQGVNRSEAQIGSALLQSIVAFYTDTYGRLSVVPMKNVEGIISPLVFEMILKKADAMDAPIYKARTLQAAFRTIHLQETAITNAVMADRTSTADARKAAMANQQTAVATRMQQAEADAEAYCARIRAGLERHNDNGLNYLGRTQF